MYWCGTIGYMFTLVCVLLQCVGVVHLGTVLLLCVCGNLMCLQYIWLQVYCCVCVNLIGCCATFGFGVTVLCVLFNEFLQYSW